MKTSLFSETRIFTSALWIEAWNHFVNQAFIYMVFESSYLYIICIVQVFLVTAEFTASDLMDLFVFR